MAGANVHGTAIVIGDTGLIFIGPSGIGKSALALASLAAARSFGVDATLIADDRVLLSMKDGAVLAECPATIAGLLEIRGTGIVRMPHRQTADIHYAILPADPANAVRLPDEDEWIDLADGIRLPLIRMLNTTINPLAVIMAKIPTRFGSNGPFGPGQSGILEF